MTGLLVNKDLAEKFSCIEVLVAYPAALNLFLLFKSFVSSIRSDKHAIFNDRWVDTSVSVRA